MAEDRTRRKKELDQIIQLVGNPETTPETIISRLKLALSLDGDKHYYLSAEERKKRSYKDDERVNQCLQDIARVLLSNLNGDPSAHDESSPYVHKTIVEVQVMLETVEEEFIRLYVSFNTDRSFEETGRAVNISEMLNNSLADLYNKISDSRKLSRESSDESLLYKLKSHKESCKQILNLLRDNNYQVVTPTLPQRHAEEHLCDKVVELIRSNKNRRFRIRGTKRPCKSCAGRMANINIREAEEIIKYNDHSGFFFMDCLRQQLKGGDYAAVRKSLELLRDELCYYSYDTESDSGCENRSSGNSYKGADYSEDDIPSIPETKKRKIPHDDSKNEDISQRRSREKQRDKIRKEERKIKEEDREDRLLGRVS